MTADFRHGIRIAIVAFGAVLVACTSGEGADRAAAPTPFVAMARGQVDVEGGMIRVLAPRNGRIESIAVDEGAEVKRGDVLATLDARQATIAVDVAAAEVAQATARVTVLKARVPQMRAQAKRTFEAAGAGAATGQSSDDAAAALAVLEAEIGAAEAAVKVTNAHLEEARAERDARTIESPADGRIASKSAHVGDVVSVDAPAELFRILPNRPRIVRAELNESYVDKVKPGMQAEVVRDADPGTVYAARVLRIGEVFGPSRLADDPVERAGAHDVECVLLLESGDLRIGQRVLVRFRP